MKILPLILTVVSWFLVVSAKEIPVAPFEDLQEDVASKPALQFAPEQDEDNEPNDALAKTDEEVVTDQSLDQITAVTTESPKTKKLKMGGDLTKKRTGTRQTVPLQQVEAVDAAIPVVTEEAAAPVPAPARRPAAANSRFSRPATRTRGAVTDVTTTTETPAAEEEAAADKGSNARRPFRPTASDANQDSSKPTRRFRPSFSSTQKAEPKTSSEPAQETAAAPTGAVESSSNKRVERPRFRPTTSVRKPAGTDGTSVAPIEETSTSAATPTNQGATRNRHRFAGQRTKATSATTQSAIPQAAEEDSANVEEEVPAVELSRFARRA